MHRSLLLAATATTALALTPAAHAAFPGEDGPILFGQAGEVGGIFSTAPGQTPELLLESDNAPDGIDVSPDGTKVLYNENDFSLWVADHDGANRTRLTPDGAEDFTAGWSPDGSKIVFATREEGADEEWRIWTMDADGGDRAPLGELSGTSPSYAPDGDRIAFQAPLPQPARGRFGWVDIAVADADGSGEPEYLTEGREPEWTPDGEALVFVRATIFSFGGPLYRVDVDTGEVEPISDEGSYDFRAPSVAPSGGRLVAETEFSEPVRGGTQYGLATMDIDGGDLTELAGGANAGGPDWGAVAEGQDAPRPRDDDDDEGDDAPAAPVEPAAAAPMPPAALPAPIVVPSRTCGSRRSFTVNVRGRSLAKVGVVVNGRRVKVARKDGRFVARVDLRRLPKGRFAVRIRKTLDSGAVRHETRRYRTCTPKPLQ